MDTEALKSRRDEIFRRLKRRVERFWGKVDKSAGDDACWPWLDVPDDVGYGQFYLGQDENNKGIKVRAHCAAFSIAADRALGYGECVLHTCDNRPCCNPAHLFSGDRGMNNRDCVAKGRNGRGAMMPQTKLNPQAVIEIRRMIADGVEMAKIARIFGVNGSAIRGVKVGKSWRYV